MPIPRENSIDSTLALLNEGYNFISRRCERLHSDAFETRIHALGLIQPIEVVDVGSQVSGQLSNW